MPCQFKRWPKASIVFTKQLHLLFIRETWFTANSSVVLQGYITFHKDRIGMGGGVAIFSKSNLNVSEALGLSSAVSEQIWVQLALDDELLLLGSIYWPPNSSHQTTNEILKNIKLNCKRLEKGTYDGLIITWLIKWINSLPHTLSTPDEQTRKFLDLLSDETLTQNIHFPTFLKANGTPTSTLDYIISDSPNRLQKIFSSPPLGSALQGHSVISWSTTLKISHKNAPVRRNRLKFKKGLYAELSKFIINHEWPTLLANKSIDDSYSTFLKIYNSVCSSFIPKIRPRSHHQFKQPWMNPTLHKFIKSNIYLS